LIEPHLSNQLACGNVGRADRVANSGGTAVKKSAATAGLVVVLGLSGCQPLEVDQVAQQSMIGLSKRDILACLGQPAQRVPTGQATEIWTYVGGQMRGYGPQWAIGLNTNLFPFTPAGSCDVVLVMTNAQVSEVGYTAVDGSRFPLGQECIFPIERCVKAP
jgi:hypothetical protein